MSNMQFWVMLFVAAIGQLPSVLWCCRLGGRKGIRPVKNWVVRCWLGYLSGARCRLAYAQLMPLPLTVSCFSKIQIGFTFLVPAHPGSPGHRAVKRVCVCVCVYIGKSSGQQDHYDLRHNDECWSEIIITCSFIDFTNFDCILMLYGFLLEFFKNVCWTSPGNWLGWLCRLTGWFDWLESNWTG